MKTFKQLIKEVFENLKENNAFSGLALNDADGSLSFSKRPKPRKKVVPTQIENTKTSSIKEKIAGLTPQAAGHLIGSCFKIFNSKELAFNFNKIHITLRGDSFEVKHLTERVNGSGTPQKDIVITREDINDILQIQNPAKVIKMIRKRRYYFKRFC